MASIFKNRAKEACEKPQVSGVAVVSSNDKFRDELINSDADSPTTVLNADADTKVLSAETPEEDTHLDEIDDAPGTTVLNFVKADEPKPVKSKKDKPKKELIEKPKGEAKKSSKKEKETSKTTWWVEIVKTGEKFKLEREATSVGKSKHSDIQIKDTQTVSRHHITFYLKADELFVEDNKSLNGTFVDNNKLEGGEKIKIEGDCNIRLSDEELRVSLDKVKSEAK